MLVSWRKKSRTIALKKYPLSKCRIFWRGYNYVHFSLSSSRSLSFVCKWWRKLVHYNTIHYPTVELSKNQIDPLCYYPLSNLCLQALEESGAFQHYPLSNCWTFQYYPILNYSSAEPSNTELSNSSTVQYWTIQQLKYPNIKLSSYVLVHYPIFVCKWWKKLVQP